MHILIAPNAFKNSLEAGKAAEAISIGLQQSKLSCTTTCFPVADGGDGTGRLLSSYLKAVTIEAAVHDPLGRPILSSFGWVEKDHTAIIELADASGLRLLTKNEYAPLTAATFGTGELILEAIKRKAERIIICIGGSATVDGGIGILQALGLQFLDAGGNELTGLPGSLQLLSALVIPGDLQKGDHPSITILCDVENLLLGPSGAAAVFGPQKGASPADVQVLDTGLARFREVAMQVTGKDMALVKHGGASGGVAAGLYTFLQATLVNGIDHFLAITGFEKELAKANLVITGEGSLDVQTLNGKGPFGVAKIAKQYSIPVIGMAGKISAEKELSPYFDKLIAITSPGMDIETALRTTYLNLEVAARELGDQLVTHKYA